MLVRWLVAVFAVLATLYGISVTGMKKAISTSYQTKGSEYFSVHYQYATIYLIAKTAELLPRRPPCAFAD